MFKEVVSSEAVVRAETLTTKLIYVCGILEKVIEQDTHHKVPQEEFNIGTYL